MWSLGCILAEMLLGKYFLEISTVLPEFRDPEVIFPSKEYTAGVDMRSLGCILAEMFLGKYLLEISIARVPRPRSYLRQQGVYRRS
jgi:serine/threonine protein kinase